MIGDVATQRIVIEDGAFFKGSVDLKKEGKPEPRGKTTIAAMSSQPAAVSSQPGAGSGANSGVNSVESLGKALRGQTLSC